MDTIIPLGYDALIKRYQLKPLPPDTCAQLDSSITGRQTRQLNGCRIEMFGAGYMPSDTLVGHLQFALRYEGVNLQVLALLFTAPNQNVNLNEIEAELCTWINTSPESRYARVSCFLYEWLTQKTLPTEDPVSSRSRYQRVVDEDQQFGLSAEGKSEGEKVARFRVLNNLPGTRDFCPLVRKTDLLKTMVQKELHNRIRQVLDSFDQSLLNRASAYLYLKETQSSFDVEREKPTPQRAQRFADLLRQADMREPLTEERLVELQNAVLDPRFHEFTWRSQQNWIGKDLGCRQQVDFVPARPEDLHGLMAGLLSIANLTPKQIDPIVLATSLAFGFVYIHPFMDGNGRIHRYLIHDQLAKAGFTPRGIVLPVSAVILANLESYIETLEHFSRGLNRLTDFHPDTPDIAAKGNEAVYYSYPDFTWQAEFLYRTLEWTVDHDLQQEITYLLGFDKACKALNELFDWPPHSLELFIQVTHANAGILSENKRKSYFNWMKDHEIAQAEKYVQQAFSVDGHESMPTFGLSSHQ